MDTASVLGSLCCERRLYMLVSLCTFEAVNPTSIAHCVYFSGLDINVTRDAVIVNIIIR